MRLEGIGPSEPANSRCMGHSGWGGLVAAAAATGGGAAASKRRSRVAGLERREGNGAHATLAQQGGGSLAGQCGGEGTCAG